MKRWYCCVNATELSRPIASASISLPLEGTRRRRTASSQLLPPGGTTGAASGAGRATTCRRGGSVAAPRPVAAAEGRSLQRHAERNQRRDGAGPEEHPGREQLLSRREPLPDDRERPDARQLLRARQPRDARHRRRDVEDDVAEAADGEPL